MSKSAFKAGDIQRFIDRHGLSQFTLAIEAGVAQFTIFRANQGENLRRKTYLAIFRAMARRTAGGAAATERPVAGVGRRAPSAGIEEYRR